MICRKIFLKRKNRRYNNLIDLLERFSNIDEKKKSKQKSAKIWMSICWLHNMWFCINFFKFDSNWFQSLILIFISYERTKEIKLTVRKIWLLDRKRKIFKKRKKKKKKICSTIRIDLVSIRVFWACKKLTTFTWRCTVNVAGARENVYEAMLLTRYLFSRGRWFPSLSRDWFLLVHPRNYFLHPLCLFFYLASPRFSIPLSFLFPSVLFFFFFSARCESFDSGKTEIRTRWFWSSLRTGCAICVLVLDYFYHSVWNVKTLEKKKKNFFKKLSIKINLKVYHWFWLSD